MDIQTTLLCIQLASISNIGQLTVAWWCQVASAILVNIGPGNELSVCHLFCAKPLSKPVLT